MSFSRILIGLLLSAWLVGCKSAPRDAYLSQPEAGARATFNRIPAATPEPESGFDVVQLPETMPIAPARPLDAVFPGVKVVRGPARGNTNIAAEGWVSLPQWARQNQLPAPQQLGGSPSPSFQLSSGRGPLILRVGQRIASLNGMQCWLGFAPILQNGVPHVHVQDAEKTLAPLLFGSPLSLGDARVLVLDPGHGGLDPGTQGGKALLEKEFSLDWALRTQALLRSNGWTVFLTRTNDVDVSLPSRTQLADEVNAAAFISLHFNSAAPRLQPNGIETYCLTPNGMPSSLLRFEDNQRLEFANNRYDRENLLLACQIHRSLLLGTRASDGGVRRARFMGVLRGQNRPAVLIEGGYLSNPQEANRIASAAYRQQLATALVDAIEAAFGRR